MFASAMDDASWLTRLTADEWLRAAQGELARAELALGGKQQRAGVTQARRAAGMAWNAVLLGIADVGERDRFGRSYMDHLRVLRDEQTVAMNVREAADLLVVAKLEQELVQLGQGDTRLAHAAKVIVEEARRRVDESARS
jgi:HEPN domain-containing protein